MVAVQQDDWDAARYLASHFASANRSACNGERRTATTAIYHAFDSAAEQAGCAILLIGHLPKTIAAAWRIKTERASHARDRKTSWAADSVS
ncbi:MAG: hypothetical protein OXC93_01870 [Rhodospirillaceae bacterium]|nr:hypothetical protein [Rhodospirillaceae bacterium]